METEIMKIKSLVFLTATFFIPSALAGELNFDDVNTAGGETHYCTEGESCVISCTGVQACDGATFYGADDFDLTLNCTGNQSCGNSAVYGPSEGKFSINLADGIYPIWASRVYAQDSASLHINSSNVTYETHYLHLYVPRETFISDDNWVDGNNHQVTMWYARFYFDNSDGHRIYMDREEASHFWENVQSSTVSCPATDDTAAEINEANLQLCDVNVKALTSADMMLVGMPGIQGETGPQGEQGPQGETGAQGAQGETGEQGETGAQGPQGEMGLQGATGAQGPQGETGEQGPQGEVGPQGEIGPQGLPGSNSLVVSSYDGVSNRESLQLSATSNSICFLTKVDGRGICKIVENNGFWVLTANQPPRASTPACLANCLSW